jgi:hypothetical protein
MYMARRPEVLRPYSPVDEERALGCFHVAVPVRQHPRGEAEGRLRPQSPSKPSLPSSEPSGLRRSPVSPPRRRHYWPSTTRGPNTGTTSGPPTWSNLPSHPSGPGTNLTKGPGSRQAGLAMLCKLMEAAETSWYFLVLSAICPEFIENSLGIHRRMFQ